MKLKILPLLLLLCLLLCACGAKVENRDSISIWYIEAQPGAEGLAAFAEGYNAALEEGLLPVSLRAFPDEESLALAFDSGRPDMLLCSYKKAEDLNARQLLTDISSVYPDLLQYSHGIEERFDYAGKSFFPLGFDLPLICSAEGVMAENVFDDPDIFCLAVSALSGDERRPVFAAEDCSVLFYQWLLSLDTEFHAVDSLDRREDNYRYVYNLLAEAAYEGGLVEASGLCSEYLRQGYLHAAQLFSSDLASEKLTGLSLNALPVFKDGREYLADCTGLAVTAREGRSRRSMAAFIKTLYADSSFALENGLCPVLEGEYLSENEMQELLLELWEEKSFHLPDVTGDYALNSSAFRESFNRALSELGVY